MIGGGGESKFFENQYYDLLSTNNAKVFDHNTITIDYIATKSVSIYFSNDSAKTQKLSLL
jgi:hypothetical protein